MSVIRCRIAREVDVYVALARARELCRSVGARPTDEARIDIAILELARNLVRHAGSGELRLALCERPSQRGLSIESCDDGPGIPDIELALRDGYSTTKTMGAGLPAVRRLMDEFAIESHVGIGTTIRTTRWFGS